MGTGNPGVFPSWPWPWPINTLTLIASQGIPWVRVRVSQGFTGIGVDQGVTVHFNKDTTIYTFIHNLHNPTQHPYCHCHQLHQADSQWLWYHHFPQALTYSKPQGTSMHVLRPLSVDYGCEIKQVGLCWTHIRHQWMSLIGKCEFRLTMWWKETYQE